MTALTAQAPDDAAVEAVRERRGIWHEVHARPGAMMAVRDDIDTLLAALDVARARCAEVEAELDAATEANHSVRVCAKHTREIVGEGCWVCDYEKQYDRAERYGDRARAAERQMGELLEERSRDSIAVKQMLAERDEARAELAATEVEE